MAQLWCRVFALTATMVVATARADEPVVEVWRLTDEANVLSAVTRNALLQRIFLFEKSAGFRVGVLIRTAFEPSKLDGVIADKFAAWRLGEGEKGGFMLVFDLHEPNAFVAVSDGLNQKLNAEACQAVVQDIMLPALRRHDYANAVHESLSRLMLLSAGSGPWEMPAVSPATTTPWPQLPQLPQPRAWTVVAIVVSAVLLVGSMLFLRG